MYFFFFYFSYFGLWNYLKDSSADFPYVEAVYADHAEQEAAQENRKKFFVAHGYLLPLCVDETAQLWI